MVRALKVIAAIGVAATALGVAIPSGASPTLFKPNRVAYCAAGNAMVAFKPDAKSVTPIYVVQSFLEYATVAGRVAAAAPTKRIYSTFAALRNDAITLSRSKSVIAAIVRNPYSQTPPGPLAIHEEKDLTTAYISAAKSSAAECGRNSKFAVMTTEVTRLTGTHG